MDLRLRFSPAGGVSLVRARLARFLLLPLLAVGAWLAWAALDADPAHAVSTDVDDVVHEENAGSRSGGLLASITELLDGALDETVGTATNLNESDTSLVANVLSPLTSQLESNVDALVGDSLTLVDGVAAETVGDAISTLGTPPSSSLTDSALTQAPGSAHEAVALPQVQRVVLPQHVNASDNTALSDSAVAHRQASMPGMPFSAPAAPYGADKGALSTGFGSGVSSVHALASSYDSIPRVGNLVVADTQGHGCLSGRCHGNPAIWPD